jgi:DNA gyrase subunit A
MGRQAKGVRGIRLAKKDYVVAMEVARPEATLLTVTESGFAKRTQLAQYRIQSRGGKGILNIKVTKKNGEVVGAKTVADKDEIMIITQNGMIVRCNIKDIRVTGRNAQGVRIISLKEKDKVSSIASVVAEEE